MAERQEAEGIEPVTTDRAATKFEAAETQPNDPRNNPNSIAAAVRTAATQRLPTHEDPHLLDRANLLGWGERTDNAMERYLARQRDATRAGRKLG